MVAETVLVVDNGGDTIKAAKTGAGNQPSVPIPNCIVKPKSAKRSFIAQEIHDLKDRSALFYRRPIEKGYLVNWDVEKEVWDKAFGVQGLKVNPASTSLLLTSAHFSTDFKQVFERTNEVVFESYGYHDCYQIAPSSLALRDHFASNPGASGVSTGCGIVLDSGYSSTHAVPYYDNHKLNYAIRRLDLGGKALTNYLKEMVSYRAWNMMSETHVINTVKERLSLCSLTFMADLEMARRSPFDKENTLVRHFVLPDYAANVHGFVLDHDTPPTGAKVPDLKSMKRGENAPSGEQVLNMSGERIAVPEALFRPSDVGLPQCGVAELIVDAVEACQPELHELMYSNIVLVGGNVQIPQFKERLMQELRPLVPTEYQINVTLADKPTQAALRGGLRLGGAVSRELTKLTVTKQEYQEHGQNICYARFVN